MADDLDRARKLLEAAEARLASQQQIVAELMASGQETSQAKKLLQIMEEHVHSLRQNVVWTERRPKR